MKIKADISEEVLTKIPATNEWTVEGIKFTAELMGGRGTSETDARKAIEGWIEKEFETFITQKMKNGRVSLL